MAWFIDSTLVFAVQFVPGGSSLPILPYCGLAFICFLAFKRNALQSAASHDHALRRIWLGVALLLVLLGIARQFHLAEQLVYLARELAKQQGWYQQRRLYQTAMITLVAGGGLVWSGVLLWWLGRTIGRNAYALIPVALLVIFAVIRACSLHQVDAILRMPLLRFTVNFWIESTLLAMIAWVAIRQLMANRQEKAQP